MLMIFTLYVYLYISYYVYRSLEFWIIRWRFRLGVECEWFLLVAVFGHNRDPNI
jgi:hypothetical protein